MKHRTDTEKKATIYAIVGTILSMGLIVLLCALLGLSYQNPPPEEQGVEVNLGDSDFGLGDNSEATESENTEMVSTTPPNPTTAENVSTQSTEKSVAITKKPDIKHQQTKVDPQPVTAKEEPKKAIRTFKKISSNGGSGQGITQGNGNQGKAGGDPNSQRYDGNPGKGGIGWSLKGRSAKALPEPSYKSNKEGKIVIKIWVDRDGNVVKTEGPAQGSTVTDANLVEKARTAAKNSKFSPDKDATENQTGFITYEFRNTK